MSYGRPRRLAALALSILGLVAVCSSPQPVLAQLKLCTKKIKIGDCRTHGDPQPAAPAPQQPLPRDDARRTPAQRAGHGTSNGAAGGGGSGKKLRPRRAGSAPSFGGALPAQVTVPPRRSATVRRAGPVSDKRPRRSSRRAGDDDRSDRDGRDAGSQNSGPRGVGVAALPLPVRPVGTAPAGGWSLQPLQLLGMLLLAFAGAWVLAGRRSDRQAFAGAARPALAGAHGLHYAATGPVALGGMPETKLRVLAEGAVVFVVVVASVLAVQALVIKPVEIPSESMVPTLAVGQQVLMERLTVRFGIPERGDIMVLKPPIGAVNKQCGVPRLPDQACPLPLAGAADTLFIKRVVALPGDRLKILEGRAYIDGKLQDQPQLAAATCNICSLPREITIPRGHFFVMGDNRGDSADSRYWGPVPDNQFVGRAVFSYWPPNKFGPT